MLIANLTESRLAWEVGHWTYRWEIILFVLTDVEISIFIMVKSIY